MLALGSFTNQSVGKEPFLLGGREALCQGTCLGAYSAGWNWLHPPLSQEDPCNRQPYLAILQFGLTCYGTVVNTSQGH